MQGQGLRREKHGAVAPFADGLRSPRSDAPPEQAARALRHTRDVNARFVVGVPSWCCKPGSRSVRMVARLPHWARIAQGAVVLALTLVDSARAFAPLSFSAQAAGLRGALGQAHGAHTCSGSAVATRRCRRRARAQPVRRKPALKMGRASDGEDGDGGKEDDDLDWMKDMPAYGGGGAGGDRSGAFQLPDAGGAGRARKTLLAEEMTPALRDRITAVMIDAFDNYQIEAAPRTPAQPPPPTPHPPPLAAPHHARRRAPCHRVERCPYMGAQRGAGPGDT